MTNISMLLFLMIYLSPFVAVVDVVVNFPLFGASKDLIRDSNNCKSKLKIIYVSELQLRKNYRSLGKIRKTEILSKLSKVASFRYEVGKL